MKRSVIGRRAVLAAAPTLLAAPAIAQGMAARTLRFIPSANLDFLDPVFTTSGATIIHGNAVFETLYGLDDKLQPRPQMAEGHTVSDDQRTWTIRLRDGLKFHDGEPVRAIDCTTSLKRWSQRDSFGQALAAFVDAWEAPDDKTIRIRLKRPCGQLLNAIAHTTPSSAFIMPERLARTDPAKQVTEMVGSGPYRFLSDEFVSGDRMAYRKFDGYVPRDEPAEWTAGGKRAWFERIEWKVMPDAATAAGAMQAGEADLYEQVLSEMVPLLSKARDLRLVSQNAYGNLTVMRFNHLTAPFNNPRLRRIVLSAVEQDDYMRANVGDAPGAYRTCYSMTGCNLPTSKELGAAIMGGKKDFDALRKAVKEAGYNGERIVILNPTNYHFIHTAGQLTADLLTRLGMKVDLQDMDFGTMFQRRTVRGPVEQGGWSIFHTGASAEGQWNPGSNFYIRGQGATGWAGWYESAEMERLTNDWMGATTDEQSQDLLDQIQLVALNEVPIVPLGQWDVKVAMRRELSGFLQSTSTLFWNLKRG